MLPSFLSLLVLLSFGYPFTVYRIIELLSSLLTTFSQFLLYAKYIFLGTFINLSHLILTDTLNDKCDFSEIGRTVAPKDNNALNIRLCDYDILHGKEDFVDMLRLKT